ncbi:hypothetical protein C8Q77DRAFT_693713 [Trametes polyzona]|nr:hypothetical protein C8Q77DRAFT_693713 [Trametes polyzona]
MSSYYREHVSFPNVTSGPAPTYPPPLAAANSSVNTYGQAQNAQAGSASQVQDDPNVRRCSVKGCGTPLPPGYPHKMCEECRGRHRIYANTKRAKRKMEKALLNSGQSVAWMPEDAASQQDQEMPSQPAEPVAGPSRSYEIAQTNDDNSQPFTFPSGWDPRALDPSLFSQTSELAGALTLPNVHNHPGDHDLFAQTGYHLQYPEQPQERQQEQQHPPPPQPQNNSQAHPHTGPPPPPPAPEIHPVLAEVLKTVPNFQLSTRVTSGPTVPVGVSAPPVDGQLPPRFCSIKGCKTLIAGNSFFKMCEPCRNRYRNYGTTKRAKWRKEKEVAVQELQKLREEEDRRRAEQGLPPLPPEEDIWHEYSASPTEGPGPAQGRAGPSTGPMPVTPDGQPTPRPPRMCTVSHCREILPGDYQYLRCERHRIQNRHHSKLKRVRDKEVKAQVYDGWAAAAGVRDPSAEDGHDERDHGDGSGGSMSPGAQQADLALNLEDIQQHLRDPSPTRDYTLPQVVAESGVPVLPPDAHAPMPDGMDDEMFEDTPLGEPSHGVPPAARGTRRTNHVCSIRACANLLSPSNPWKMCDLCRSRDRAGRRLKALRDSGLIPPEIADPKLERMKMEVEGKGRSAQSPVAEPGEKKPRKKKAKKADKEAGAADAPGAGAGGGGNVPAEPGGGDASSGSIAPSVLQLPGEGAGSEASVFQGVPDQNNIVFMDPLSPEQAALIKLRHEKVTGNFSARDDAQPPSTTEGVEQSASATAKKKRGKGKGKAKTAVSSQTNAEPEASTSQAGGHPEHTQNPSAVGDTSPPPQPDPSQVPQYPPPPNGYPYYVPPPYMPPYPPPTNYGYPYSPPKGPYAPPPPMYQPPYGAYPYPYPGQPYGYPGPPYPPPPGHSYPPPPAGQGYPPPPAGQPYPPAPPYAYPYPPPPTYQSPPPPATSEQEQAAHEHEQQPQPPPSPPRPPPPVQFNNIFSDQPAEPPHQEGPESQDAAAPESASARQRFSTFIVRTGETYEKQSGAPDPRMNGSKPVFGTKRKRGDDDGGNSNAGDGSGSSNGNGSSSGNNNFLEPGVTYSQFRLDFAIPVPAVPGSSGVEGVMMGAPEPAAAEPTPGPVSIKGDRDSQSAVAQGPSAPGEQPSERGQGACSNKNCRRPLAASAVGALCERCKERLKKKQVKAKHRFKLEPKSLLGRSASVRPGTGTGSAGPGIAAVPA